MSGQDLSSNKLALQVARRQKRLTYWREQFTAHAGSKDARDQVEELFQTYQLLLTRLVRSASSKNAAEIEDSDRRLAALDRELTTLFEARRQLTSRIGTAAISS